MGGSELREGRVTLQDSLLNPHGTSSGRMESSQGRGETTWGDTEEIQGSKAGA